MTLGLGLLGGAGRMGRTVQNLIHEEYSNQAQIIAAPARGESLDSLLKSDAIIDFSLPEAVIALKDFWDEKKPDHPLPPIALGSTGWNETQRKELDAISKQTLLFTAPNFSTGVYALHRILNNASPLLRKLGYEPVLIEGHHVHKKDAPSGTAVSLQQVIDADHPESVQTHAIRAGEIIGEHEVCFYGKADELRISHRAQDRSIFARGAIDVAIWLARLRREDPSRVGRLHMADYFCSLNP